MLIKYSGKYVKIYFNMKITFLDFLLLLLQIFTVEPPDTATHEEASSQSGHDQLSYLEVIQ